MKNDRLGLWLATIALGCVTVVVCATVPACTVIRYRDPPEGGPVVEPGEPPVVDLLVLVDVDPSAEPLATPLGSVLTSFTSSLARNGVELRRVGVAPLRHRVGGAVPLIAGGTVDEVDLAGAIRAYSTGELAAFLEDQADDEHSNLLELGANLASRPIYQPTPGAPGSGSITGEAFFGPPADGWVVLTLSGRAPPCGASDCDAAAGEHAAALLASDPESGELGWLSPPGDRGLSRGRVIHVFATPPEVGSSFAALSEACTAHPNFPVAVLDSLQPAEVYRSEVARRLAAGGAGASWVDLCGALSSLAPSLFDGVAGAIAGALGAP